MIKVRCADCGERYPAGTDHQCARAEYVKVTGLESLGNPSPEFVAKAVAFYEAHLKRSREGMRKVRKNKSLKEKGE